MSVRDLIAPDKPSAESDLSAFDSGEAIAENRVVGYYSLAVGAATHEQVPGRIKRNMPNPVPVMILGRLVVDKMFQGNGIGVGLLRDAVLRTMQAAEIAGIRALLVHAISDVAKCFYEAIGFIASPVDAMTVMISLAEAEKIILRGKLSR